MIKIMSAKEAYKTVKDKFSDMEIYSMMDFDSNHFVIGLCENNDMSSSTYYSINKMTGEIKYFSPIENIEKFSDSIDNKSIDIENF